MPSIIRQNVYTTFNPIPPFSEELAADDPESYSLKHLTYVNGRVVQPHPEITRIDTFFFSEPAFMPPLINYAFWRHPCEAHIVSSVKRSSEWLSVDRFRQWHDLLAPLSNSHPIVVLDIGAQQGDTTVQMAPFAGLTIAMEAHPRTFIATQTNADVNPHLNIHPYNVAASPTGREATETWCYSCNGGADDRTGHECFNASLVNVPSYLHQRYSTSVLKHLAFVKIDTEGYDVPILRTLRPLLEGARTKPWIYLEWYTNHESRRDRRRYHEAAADLGYGIFTPDGTQRIDVLTHPKLPDLLFRPV